MKNSPPNQITVLLAGAALLAGTARLAAEPDSTTQLQEAFVQPPDDARIMVRWWWFGPAVTEPELEREMRLMKAGGIGGFEVQPTYPLALDGERPGLRNLKFMSPEFLDALRFTAAKARELGLRMDLTLGSGWPYGGPQFSAEQGATAIQTRSVPVPAGQRSAPVPTLREGQSLIAAFVKVGDTSEEVPVIDKALQLPAGVTSEAQVQLFLSRGGIMAVKRPAYGADGRVIDHYNPSVIEKFIKEIAEPEIEACEPNPPYAVFCDSLEVSGENWTPNFLAEFKSRRGYDLGPLLPALFNDIGRKTLDIRHDWGQTVTELFNEYFNRRFTKLAKDHRTRFRIQGYGTPPAALYSCAYCDLPEGEGYQWKSFSATRWSSSAVHLLGKPVASSETFTWLHSPVFRATPLDMKAEADLHFLCGINQILCHGWPYTAQGVAYPGWSFYAAGAFNEKNPWWLVMPDVTKYLQRVSFILRQGTPANDVALFLPNSDAWAALGRNFSLSDALGRKVSGLVRAITEASYNLDFFDDQLLAMRGEVSGNTLAFGNVRYRIVVLPGVERIQLATMRKLDQFAQGGGIVVATRRLPDLVPGYKATDADTQSVRDIAKRMFKNANAPGIFIGDETLLGAALAPRLAPDAAMSLAAPEIGFVHRHTDGGEVYFVANTSNQPKSVKASFRVEGMQAEIWDPMNGQVGPATVVDKSAGATTVDLNLSPYGSTIVVFTHRSLPAPKIAPAVAVLPQPVDLSTGWTVKFGRDGKPVALDKLTSWSEIPGQTNFSGVATYEKTITIADEMLQDGLSLSFDFGQPTVLQSSGGGRGGGGFHVALEGPVREAAVLYLNDERIGSVWSPPYSIPVSGHLEAGENKVRIEVANLAMNYMAGIKLPNYNYAGVTQRFGNRFQPQHLDLVQVLPSGLLGPIRLVAAAQAK
jgi:hypothetical protein